MLKLKQWLGGLLILQVILIAGFYFSSQKETEFDAASTLISLPDKSVDKIVIDGDQHTVTLVRRDNQWILPGYFDLPADSDKVNELIEKVSTAKTGWPIATSANSHERMDVSASKYPMSLS